METKRKMSELLTILRDEMTGTGWEKKIRLFFNRAKYDGMCSAAIFLYLKVETTIEENKYIYSYISTLPKNHIGYCFKPRLLRPRYELLNKEIERLKEKGE